MVREEILTIQQLRESIFENRANQIILRGIYEYIKRNENEYKVEEVFEVCCTLVGATRIYHKNKNSLKDL
jgi:hypothetical protein